MVDFSQIGYCTNVHAGADLATTRANLEKYALDVKRRVSPNGPMGVGLWLSANSADTLQREGLGAEFRAWLNDVGLVPYTFNGFPFGDFHSDVVKHRVYEPTWWDAARFSYTAGLIAIQNGLLPPGMNGSVSTLPIAWGHPRPPDGNLEIAALLLRTVANHLKSLEREQGRFICLCLEPEPGCVLQRSEDVVRFFHDYLLRGGNEETTRRYIRVCHDVCHSVVMCESQAEVFRAYHNAGIAVGKVQISSAVVTPPLDNSAEDQRANSLAQLAEFREPRYLHQTTVQSAANDYAFYEDLPLALQTVADPKQARGTWRVHFHVPIYLERFGHLLASRSAILECLKAAKQYSDVKHFEVETYAWGVLPPELRQPDLAAGIADELKWYISCLQGESP
ncbi:MAG: metabolite traffic protein EboE [Gemmataceae bacterium]